MVDDGIEYCVMETSSQAFHQMRLAGINFKVGVFTNLTQDHLDYHGTIEEYKKCKKELYEILAQNTGKSYEEIEKTGDRDSWFTSQEALDYGLIDEILIKNK